MKNLLVGSVVFLAVLAVGQVTLAAGLDTPSSDLPPDGVYLSAEDVHAMYTGADLEIVLEAPIHKPIAQETQRRILPGTDTEEELFYSELTGNVTLNNPPLGPMGPVLLTGWVTTQVQNHPLGTTTGTFDTEIVSMSLSGNMGGIQIQVRESPTRQSTGRTSVSDIGGGNFHVDSFFDVFTELSVDMGTGFGPWIPSTGGPRMILQPEPGSLTLLGIGTLCLLGCMWRRKRAV